MSRFFHECFTDPALGAVIGFAFIFALVLTWLVVRDKLRQRQLRRRLERERSEDSERRATASRASERSN
ncbi:MAG: hypothetical protein ACLQU3_18860 [Limisphaerales bacterium]